MISCTLAALALRPAHNLAGFGAMTCENKKVMKVTPTIRSSINATLFSMKSSKSQMLLLRGRHHSVGLIHPGKAIPSLHLGNGNQGKEEVYV